MFDEVEDIIFSILDFSTNVDKIRFLRVNKNWEYLIYRHLKFKVKNVKLIDLWNQFPISKSDLYCCLNAGDDIHNVIKIVTPVCFEDEIEFLKHLFVLLNKILSTKEIQNLGFFLMYQFLIKEDIEYQLSYSNWFLIQKRFKFGKLTQKKKNFKFLLFLKFFIYNLFCDFLR
jgi:hypothetical protein